MKILGIVLLVVGLLGLAYFGYQAWQDSESFNVLGVDVAVSKADWMPVIVSALVAVLGYVLSRVKR
ncbi:MAG TPA: transglycosylase [Bacteroidales bacterium]|nr:transglycosylase [Bacteroidales bacterium]